jgi:predicted N-acetyltransferase YhbS
MNWDLTSEIYNIATELEHQKKGIGSKSFQFVLNELSTIGYSNVEIGAGTLSKR